MERQEMEELVRLVMEQVMGRMATDPGSRGALEREKLLSVGPPERVPESVARGCRVCSLSDYEACGDILAYRRVVITALTMAELADIAAGRDAELAQKAVLQALLQGVEVYLCEEALPHRAYAGKGSKVLYAVLEGYANTLQTYGVRPACLWEPKPEIPAKPPKFQAPAMPAIKGSACPNCAMVITEEGARALVSGGDSSVTIPQGAIVTPSAWDVLRASGAEIIKE